MGTNVGKDDFEHAQDIKDSNGNLMKKLDDLSIELGKYLKIRRKVRMDRSAVKIAKSYEELRDIENVKKF